jgi:chemotaxis protein methyltransferase CheR
LFELAEKDRIQLSNFIEKKYGIKMPPSKKILLQSRLQKRALQLGYSSIRQYMDFLFSPQGQQIELDQFATIVSTHKTEFFRENDHFDSLKKEMLPDIVSNRALGKDETLVLWSAASSTGEEVYSIAITVYDFFKQRGNMFPKLKIIGTDISDAIVNSARKAIYCDSAISSIPYEYRHYFMKSKDPARHVIRVVPEIRQYTDFRQQNLMDQQYKVKGGIHVIFCRNVLIYFDKYTQEQILRKIINLLAPGGYLLIGHSETLSGMDLSVEQVQLTIYKKVSVLS